MDEKTLKKMIDEALDLMQHAYAPYSKYNVGSTVLTARGNIYRGVNVENSSYGATICAERAAVLSAVTAEGPEMKLESVVVATHSSPAAGPCGMCLQVLSEFGDSNLEIVMVNDKGEVIKSTLEKLLPFSFKQVFLKK
ncbi:MAG: cytidine deaminase [Deltaproteobacteria bacterium]|nr:cytidine deaminase [Deltaproteobacteria bacterium]